MAEENLIEPSASKACSTTCIVHSSVYTKVVLILYCVIKSLKRIILFAYIVRPCSGAKMWIWYKQSRWHMTIFSILKGQLQGYNTIFKDLKMTFRTKILKKKLYHVNQHQKYYKLCLDNFSLRWLFFDCALDCGQVEF